MYFEITLGVLSMVLLLEVLRSHRILRNSLLDRQRTMLADRYPSVTVIRPIKGLDVGVEQNIAAALDTGYPGDVETIFVFDDKDEPALPLVRQAMAKHEVRGKFGKARVLLCGQPPPGHTCKLNAMIKALEVANGELVAFADSDIRPDRRALTSVVETLLEHPEAGSAFSPVVSSMQPLTLGDAGYALLLNGLYGVAANAASRRRGGKLPFIMGQFMVLRREAIEAIGGLETARGQLVDDMYLGARIKEEGYDNMVCPHTVPVIQQGMTLTEFWGVYRRWIAFGRSGLPGVDFKITSFLHGLVYWAGLTGVALGAWLGLWHVAALCALAPVAVAASITVLHGALGGAPLQPRHWLVALGLLLVAPAVFASLLTNKQVSWRGRTYELGLDSRLSGEQKEQAMEQPDEEPAREVT